MSKSIYDIQEDKISIKGKSWNDDELRSLSAKKIAQVQKMVDYWSWLFERGRDMFDKYEGNILTDEQIATYEDVEDKIVLQPPVMKSPIRALLGQAIKSRRSGQITTEGGSLEKPAASAEEVDVMSCVMKDMEIKTKEKYKIRDAIHDSLVSCVPNVLYYDLKGPIDGCDGKVALTKLSWDSALVGPFKFQEADGSDIREMMWYDVRSEGELIANFPEMEDQIRAHWQAGKTLDSQALSSISEWEGSDSSEYRDKLRDILQNSIDLMSGPSGLVPVFQHLFPIRRKESIWVNIFDDTGNDFVTRPPKWNKERWQEWVEKNSDKYRGPYERTVTTLWMTVFTSTGLILANEKHWFQENGKLPCSFWMPALINGTPTGPAVDLVDDCVANCVAEIEYLDDLRKGSGTLVFAREGTIGNIENLAEEANKSFGLGIVKRDAQGPISELVHEVKRVPNDHWKTYAEQRKTAMYENTRLNESMQGAAAPRQAAIAKELEIAQAMVVNALYLDNFNRSFEFHQNLKLKIIPYVYTQYDVVDITDEETGLNKTVPINQPVAWDAEGDVTEVVNDITSNRYKWKINPVDDSPTAQVRQMEEALTIINAAAGPLLTKDPTGKMFSKFLMAVPNQFLKDAGKAMMTDVDSASQAQSQIEQQKALTESMAVMAKAKADLLKAEKAGLSLTVNGDQLMKYPNLYQYWQSLQQIWDEKVNNVIMQQSLPGQAQQMMAPEEMQNQELQMQGELA